MFGRSRVKFWASAVMHSIFTDDSSTISREVPYLIVDTLSLTADSLSTTADSLRTTADCLRMTVEAQTVNVHSRNINTYNLLGERRAICAPTASFQPKP